MSSSQSTRENWSSQIIINMNLIYTYLNLSLKNGTLPNELKKARVNPIYKSGSRKSFDKYCPISVLSILSKIFKKCVYRQLVNYLKNNNLLSSFQFSFCSRRSTETAATFFTDNIRSAIDEWKYTGTIYIDLSKAFDTISHSILQTLHNYGISGRSNLNCLFCRSQQVTYLGTLSSPQSIICGVPQGSILGPLLFIVYFNDAAKTLLSTPRFWCMPMTQSYFVHTKISTLSNNASRLILDY